MGTFMTKHCGSALRYGSPMKQEDPKDGKKKSKKLTESEYVDRELTKRMKKNPKMTAQEVLAATKSIKGLYKQENLGN